MAKTKVIRRYVARPKARRSRRAGFTLPLAVLAGMAIPAGWAIKDFQAGGPTLAGSGLITRMSGFNPTTKRFEPNYLMQGLVPVLAGVFVHKYIGGKMGINRVLSSAGVPFVRL